MRLDFNTYTTASGETILYRGEPDFVRLEELAGGPGDIWHSGLDQGFANAFPEIVYQATVFLWYLRDFQGLQTTVSWRLNPEQFAVRKRVWDHFDGFSDGFSDVDAAALHFGYNALLAGAVILHVSGLFEPSSHTPRISATDRYRFFFKSFKRRHAVYMLARRWWNPSDWFGFVKGRTNFETFRILPAPVLNDKIEGEPTVTYVLPTMNRQDFVLQLLGDLANQKYPPLEVIVVDATRKEIFDKQAYENRTYPFELKIVWKPATGSCASRNIAIDIAKGDYILFGDDDLRLPPDFIENHIRFLQTRKVEAATGLDIRAGVYTENLDDLYRREKSYPNRWRSGVSLYFSNSNSIVSRRAVKSVIGNDLNYEGGYGEDNDFGLSLAKKGVLVLHNPYGLLLHLKPPAGGYRVWGQQAKVVGAQRKRQPWELDKPVGKIRPVPSPTLMYYYMKHFDADAVREYRFKTAFNRIFSSGLAKFPVRLVQEPLKQLQFKKSRFYGRKLRERGPQLTNN